MASKVALIIVFNHRYDKNIPVLESIYAGRFSNIYYLVPFYDGDKENVIPVYDTSYCFQGYFAQGFRHYFRNEYEHYIFAGDDLLLNPDINEYNYAERFRLKGEACFVPEVHSLHRLANNNTLRFFPAAPQNGKERWYWNRMKQILDYRHKRGGAESANELPSYEEAERRLKAHGYPIQNLTTTDLFGDYRSFAASPSLWQKIKRFGRRKLQGRDFELPYPVVVSYSDIVIAHSSAIKKFAQYCGVFAVNELFVEFAVPTALLLACNKVVTEPEVGKRGLIYWAYTPAEATHYANALQPYGNRLSALMQNFPKDKLYIHPIKLSKWGNAAVKEEA